MPEVTFRLKCSCTKPGDRVLVVGSDGATGDWEPQRSKVELTTDQASYPWWSGSGALAGGQLEFKFVVVGSGGDAKWEATIKNRTLQVAEGLEFEAEFDKKGEAKQKGSRATAAGPPPTAGAAQQAPAAQKPPEPKKAEPPAAFLPPPGGAGSAEGVVQRIAEEDAKRRSWRNKLDLSRALLEGGEVKVLGELACLQAYLTWVASGQIKCEEDGGHHRPCAHADASRKITALLWQFAARGDAERFVARRIFPSLPSYADQFTCAVPMTRIRDIAHRGDIPHDLKQEIKHTLQNKLHRCADPGDLVTCERLIQKVRRENCYSQAFVHEFEIFYKELKEFFNAGGLDEMAQQVAGSDSSLRSAVDRLMGLKHNDGDRAEQLAALTDLRQLVAPRAEGEQNYLLLDLELERYAFVVLSQLAGQLEHDGGDWRGTAAWWQRLLQCLQLALTQSQLAGIASEECGVVASELRAVAQDAGNGAKAQFAAMRLCASADRALRICFSLTEKLEKAYVSVPALGGALRIDGHAVSVFVEAEMRASILFQVSKLVQLVTQRAKRDAGLPLWTAIAAGSVVGRCVRCNTLADSWSCELPREGAIVFCNEAGGDEELPGGVRGVVVARDLPVLSHLALRARQLGAVFGCTSERPLYDGLLSCAAAGAAARLTVEASGNVRLEQVGEDVLKASGASASPDAKAKPKGGAAPKVTPINLTANQVLPAIGIASSPQTAGSKASSSGKLESIAAEVGFEVPTGLAVPFGVMAKVVQGEAVEAVVDTLQKALGGDSKKVEECALAARAVVEKCRVPKEVLDALMTSLPEGTSRVAVRSSANCEDLEGVSGAGLHDSVLGVDAKDPDQLERAIQTVWGSMFTLRAVQSRHAAKMPLFHGISMGVLVQPMVSLEGKAYAFIAFSKDVVEGDAGAVYLEVCVGLGETLASANEPGTPYRLVVRKDPPHAVTVKSLGSFSFGLQDAAGGPKAVRVDYSKERLSTDRAFLEQLAREVAKVAAKVEESYGLPMDMEGVVLERDTGREVHLVQARPIVES